MSSDPDYIVIDGIWYDRTHMPHTIMGKARLPAHIRPSDDETRYEASGEFEFREDGAVAEVWKPVT